MLPFQIQKLQGLPRVFLFETETRNKHLTEKLA